MKILIQRVKQASVKVQEEVVSEIKVGLLVFLGVEKGDSQKDIDYLINKVLNLRIFENSLNKIDKSIMDIDGEILVVSQFTLCGNIRKGNRPSFTDSELPKKAEKMYNTFISNLKLNSSLKIATGIFGANMDVSLINHGPFTLSFHSKN